MVNIKFLQKELVCHSYFSDVTRSDIKETLLNVRVKNKQTNTNPDSSNQGIISHNKKCTETGTERGISTLPLTSNFQSI